MVSLARSRAAVRVFWLGLVAALLALSGCGGGGGGGGAPSGPPPIIIASLVSFPDDGVPPGAVSTGSNTLASVAVLDASSHNPIGSAAVSINGKTLAYVPTYQDYEAELEIEPGSPVTLRVSVGGATYVASGAQFNAYPTITSPASDATWLVQNPNLVAWTGVAPSSSALYALAVLDTSGFLVWPADSIQTVAPPATSFTIPAFSLSPGNRLVIVGVASAIAIPNADANSGLVISGFNYVPVTVTNTVPATLTSIAVTPHDPTLGKDKTLQLTATGTYSNGSTQDLTAQAAWISSDPAKVTVGVSGLATGVDYGAATITATLGGISGSVTATVFEPTPSPAPPLSQSVSYQIDYAHSGRAVFGTPVAFPPSADWSSTLAGAASYPLIAGGRVFVTAVAPAAPPRVYGTELYALDLQTGNVVWGPVLISGTYYWSGHAYDNGKLFVVNFDGLLRSFDAATGTPGWSMQLPGQYAFSSPPTAVDGIVYVGGAGSGGTLYAVDEATGNVLWSSPVANGDHSSPAVSADGVFVSYPCQVYKFDPLTGSSLWHYSGGCSGGGGKTSAYANGRLYVRDPIGGPGTIFDAATGTSLGTFNATPIPALSTQTGYFLSSGTLRAVDLASQQVLWSFAGDGQLVSAPIVVNDAVIVGSATGNVYALDGATGTQRWSGTAGAAIPPPDEQNVSQPITGFGAGEGWLVVPAGNVLKAWRISGP